MTSALLFVVAAVGGALNAVAGGGSFLTLPALLYIGVPPVSANATSTFAMWPASVASALAYRQEIGRARHWMMQLGAISLLGGLAGGLLLVRTSDAGFVRLLPWLMLTAALTFSCGDYLTTSTRRRYDAWRGRAVARKRDGAALVGRSVSRPVPRPHATAPPTPAGVPAVPRWTLPLQFLIAVYGGYFGGGMGIMMLAGMSVAGMTEMHEMNALKAALAIAINGVALAAFIFTGAISWAPGAIMMVGGIAGGYAGASLARRLPGPVVRRSVIVVAWMMTIYFFVR